MGKGAGRVGGECLSGMSYEGGASLLQELVVSTFLQVFGTSLALKTGKELQKKVDPIELL